MHNVLLGALEQEYRGCLLCIVDSVFTILAVLVRGGAGQSPPICSTFGTPASPSRIAFWHIAANSSYGGTGILVSTRRFYPPLALA